MRGTRCSPHYRPSEEVLEYAEFERPDLDVEEEIAAFLDHWLSKPGKSAYRLDWDRTFRAWLRRAHERNRSPLSTSEELLRRDNEEIARQRRQAEAAEAAEGQESDKDDELFDLLSGDR